MYEKLPPKAGMGNRAARFALQAIDKVLYPNSNRVLSGGEGTPWSPTTRRELNDIAQQHGMRRYNVGGGYPPGMTDSDHYDATALYKGVASNALRIIEPIQTENFDRG